MVDSTRRLRASFLTCLYRASYEAAYTNIWLAVFRIDQGIPQKGANVRFALFPFFGDTAGHHPDILISS